LSASMSGSPINAESVEQARQLRGFSKAEFADEISLTRQKYNQYLEAGFPADFHEILSSTLAVPTEFLSTSHPHMLESTNINFRAGRKTTVAHREAAIANVNLLTQIDSRIRQKYTTPSLDWVVLSNEVPKLAAQLLRQAWGLGTNPAPNMVHLYESRGISVYGLTNIAKDVDVFSARNGPQPFIFTSRKKTAASTLRTSLGTLCSTTTPWWAKVLSRKRKLMLLRRNSSYPKQHSKRIF